MNKKVLALMFGIILLTGITTAGLFDFFNKEKKLPFNITQDFNKKKMTLPTKDICDTKNSLSISLFKKPTKCLDYKVTNKITNKITYSEIDLSSSNYFKENSQGITKFSNN
ncbi:MAG: hypothetical protein U9Q99_00055 [Nanoarchaeota archaeon]|nr:hypothetical protein [Nanoarchaeota archaeon]